MIFHIYGSGDKGSAELVDHCIANRIGYMFFDIRTSTRGVKENLIHLHHHGLVTVPQVFTIDNTYVGNFETFLQVTQ